MINLENEDFLRRVRNTSAAWSTAKAARWYARDVSDSFSVQTVHLAAQVKLVASLIQPGSTVADIGCGTGALTIALARQGYEVTGFDISGAMLRELAKRSRALPVTTRVADVRGLNPSFGLFDGAVSRWTLSHFSDWAEMLKPVSSVLKPGGLFVFDIKNREHEDFVSSATGARPKKVANPDYFPPVLVSQLELEEALAESGFELLERVPHGLLDSNQMFTPFLLDEMSTGNSKKVGRLLLKFPELRSLVESLEFGLTPALPIKFSFWSLVVARKK